MIKKGRNLLKTMACAEMVFYLFPPLMLLLTAGTIAQKPMGLYAAQKMFFSSFFFFWGPVPIPGGYMLIGLIAISLALKFFLNSEWSLRKAGINITHFGILILLVGSLLTAINAREGFMVIPENTQSQYIYDYHERRLYIFENDVLLKAVPFQDLRLRITDIPFDLAVMNTCENCAVVKREDEGNFKGMAQFMALKDMPSARDPEANLTGLTFQIKNMNEQSGTYIAFEGMPEPVIIKANGKEYKIIFGKQQRILPFSVRLVDFKRDIYPGTDKARGYSSDIIIIDGNLEWPERIEMNKPLRYKGYTFYQSSFEQAEAMQATILSVVENKGRLFPYISTLIIATGLLLHIGIIFRLERT